MTSLLILLVVAALIVGVEWASASTARSRREQADRQRARRLAEGRARAQREYYQRVRAYRDGGAR